MKEPLVHLDYTEKDGILYPNLQISNSEEADQPLGRYGRMALEYLRENHPDRYTALKMDGSLMETMHRIQDEATEQIETMTQQMLKADPCRKRRTRSNVHATKQPEAVGEEIRDYGSRPDTER